MRRIAALSLALAAAAFAAGCSKSSKGTAADGDQPGIGPDGGEIEGPDGTRLVIPAGAVANITVFSIERLPDAEAAGLLPAGRVRTSPGAYGFRPDGFRFAKDVEVWLPVDPQRLPAGRSFRDAEIHQPTGTDPDAVLAIFDAAPTRLKGRTRTIGRAFTGTAAAEPVEETEADDDPDDGPETVEPEPEPDPEPEPEPEPDPDDRPACEPTGPAPTIVVTEIMADPLRVAKGSGQWIELYNPGAAAVEISGLDVVAGGRAARVCGLTVPAGGYAVIARNGDPAVNGGVIAAGVYGTGTPVLGGSPGGPIVTLLWAAGATPKVVDAVDASRSGWPTILQGRSLQLDPSVTDALAADDGRLWCEATTEWGPGRDLGTPGGANQPCPRPEPEPEDEPEPDLDDEGDEPDGEDDTPEPDGDADVEDDEAPDADDTEPDADEDTVEIIELDRPDETPEPEDEPEPEPEPDEEETVIPPPPLVVSEVMVNPNAVSDARGEWFELCNPSATGTDLSSAVYRIGGTPFAFPTAFAVPAGGCRVVGASTDTGLNGGVPVDAAWGLTERLFSTGSIRIERQGSQGLEILAELYWNADQGWPVVAGRSMQLDPDGVNLPLTVSSWCEGFVPMTNGDSGTPGAPNPPCAAAGDFDPEPEEEGIEPDEAPVDPYDAFCVSRANAVNSGVADPVSTLRCGRICQLAAGCGGPALDPCLTACGTLALELDAAAGPAFVSCMEGLQIQGCVGVGAGRTALDVCAEQALGLQAPQSSRAAACTRLDDLFAGCSGYAAQGRADACIVLQRGARNAVADAVLACAATGDCDARFACITQAGACWPADLLRNPRTYVMPSEEEEEREADPFEGWDGEVGTVTTVQAIQQSAFSVNANAALDAVVQTNLAVATSLMVVADPIVDPFDSSKRLTVLYDPAGGPGSGIEIRYSPSAFNTSLFVRALVTIALGDHRERFGTTMLDVTGGAYRDQADVSQLPAPQYIPPLTLAGGSATVLEPYEGSIITVGNDVIDQKLDTTTLLLQSGARVDLTRYGQLLFLNRGVTVYVAGVLRQIGTNYLVAPRDGQDFILGGNGDFDPE